MADRTVRLKVSERRKLKALLKGRQASARERIRAQVLLLSDKGWNRVAIAEVTQASVSTVGRVRQQYGDDGLDLALRELPRSGSPSKLTPRQEQEIVAVACSSPPEGFARWSLRLLTEEVHRRGIVESVSRELIRVVLHSHDLKPWLEKPVLCHDSLKAVSAGDRAQIVGPSALSSGCALDQRLPQPPRVRSHVRSGRPNSTAPSLTSSGGGAT